MFQRTKLCTSLLVAFGGGLLAAHPAFAQDQGGQVQRVEITGSSIKRVDAETDAPVQTLSREDIARTGATNVEELLKTISATTSSGSTVAASASGATTGGISTVSLRGLTSLRTLVLINGMRSTPYGAPSDSVSVDIDSIPVAAIERVEILKEGAGAVYGSDAIAGVINFILRKDYNGAEVNAYTGTSYDHRGSISRVSVLGGKQFDRGNVTMLFTAEHDAPLYGRDRPFSRTSIRLDKDNFAGSSRTDYGNINVPGISGTFSPGVSYAFDPTIDNGIDPTTGLPRPKGGYVAGAGPNDCGPHSVYSAPFSPTGCVFDTAPYVSLYPEIKRVGAMITGRYDVSDNHHLHTEVSLSNKQQDTSIQPSPIDSAFGIPFTLTTANPYYPTTFINGLCTTAATETAAGLKGGLCPSATPSLRVRYRPFITGERELLDDSTNLRVVVGADGTMGGWDYDANLVYAQSQLTEHLVSGYFRINDDASGPGIESLLNGQMKDSAGNTLWVNPFGQNSAAVVSAAHSTNFVGTAFKSDTSMTLGQFKLSNSSLAKLPAGDVGAAAGIEVRRDSFNLQSSDALASGNISGYGGNFFPIDKSRSVLGVFGELQIPIVKGLDVDAAVRYDRYGATDNPNTVAAATSTLTSLSSVNGDLIPTTDVTRIANESTVSAASFGQTTGKVGAIYKIVPKVMAVRATFSTGFRAPSLLELYGPLQTGVSAVQNDPARCNITKSGDDCTTQFNIFSGGNGALKPEKSKSFTLGTVIEPVKNVSFTADYFHIKVQDLITTLGSDYLLAHEAQYPNKVFRGAPDSAFPNLPGPIIAIDQRSENITSVVVAGVDFDLSTALDTGVGRFGFDLNGTWNQKWDSINPDGSKSSAIGQTSSAAPGVVPRTRAAGTVSYRMPSSKLEGSVTYNWQSGFTDICGSLDQNDFGGCLDGISPPKVRAYHTTDLQLKWDPTKTFSGTFGVRNVFNNQPPYVNGSGGAFQAGYDPTYVDPHGRFFYVSGTVRF